MNKKIFGFIALTAFVTFLICAWMLGRIDPVPRCEVGRYAWGRNGTAVLDTTDGTVYYLEDAKFDNNTMPTIEVRLPIGKAWRRKSVMKDL